MHTGFLIQIRLRRRIMLFIYAHYVALFQSTILHGCALSCPCFAVGLCTCFETKNASDIAMPYSTDRMIATSGDVGQRLLGQENLLGIIAQPLHESFVPVRFWSVLQPPSRSPPSHYNNTTNQPPKSCWCIPLCRGQATCFATHAYVTFFFTWRAVSEWLAMKPAKSTSCSIMSLTEGLLTESIAPDSLSLPNSSE